MKKITLLCFLLSTIITYSQTQLLSQLDETYNGVTWENSSGYNYEYDGNNNLKFEIYLYWDGTSWVQTYRTEYIYDTNNRVEEEISQIYDPINGLQNSDKTTYHRDVNGNVDLVVDYDWDLGWVEDSRTTITYAGTMPMIGIFEEYNGTTWVNEDKSTLSYNPNNTISEIFDEVWDGTGWVTDYKDVFTYDGNYISTVSSSDWNGTTWVDDGTITYMVDGNGNRTSETEDYSGSSDTTIYTYDMGALMSNFANPFADYTGFQYLYEDYPYVNKILSKTNSDGMSRSTYDYNNVLSVNDVVINRAIQLEVYPNPAIDIVTIKSSENIKLINVFNTLGSKVISSQRNELNVSHLSKGLYFINISLENGSIMVKKLIKQ